jgi:hypothetical protein
VKENDEMDQLEESSEPKPPPKDEWDLSENKLLTRICWGRLDSEVGSLFVDPNAPLTKMRTLIAKLALERVTENGCGPDAFLFVFKGSTMQRSKETMRKTDTVSIDDDISRVVVINKDPAAVPVDASENNAAVATEENPSLANEERAEETKDALEQGGEKLEQGAEELIPGNDGLQEQGWEGEAEDQDWTNGGEEWGAVTDEWGADSSDWVACQDDKGNTYYYNNATEAVSWESPW